MIDLQSLIATSLSYGHGTLTLFDAGHVVDQLAISGNLVSADFGLRSDGQGGTDVYGRNPYAGGFVPAFGVGIAGQTANHGAGILDQLTTSMHAHSAV